VGGRDYEALLRWDVDERGTEGCANTCLQSCFCLNQPYQTTRQTRTHTTKVLTPCCPALSSFTQVIMTSSFPCTCFNSPGFKVAISSYDHLCFLQYAPTTRSQLCHHPMPRRTDPLLHLSCSMAATRRPTTSWGGEFQSQNILLIPPKADMPAAQNKAWQAV
jgi:hypothetical protein